MFANHHSSQIQWLSQPRCYENPKFKACIQRIFSISLRYLPSDRFFLSGGCLSRSYLDSEMSDGHRRTFGDIDFKLPSYSKHQMTQLLAYFKSKSRNNATSHGNMALIRFFNEVLDNGTGLKACYLKRQNTMVNDQPITYERVVMNLEMDGISIDFVVFEETLETHALDLDLSVCAGFYNPSMTRIFFPLDNSLQARSADDVCNKQLNLLFPDRCIEQFNSDPTRLLRIVSALSRSDYVLSERLRVDMVNYISMKQSHVFSSVNADRLYHHIKKLFFSGHAVKNLTNLRQFQLLDELFFNINTLPETDRSLSLHLMQCVAVESDLNCDLSPSRLFYAAYWFWVKNKPYNPYMISELSNNTIRYSIDDALDETIHQNNVTVLTEWEAEYYNRLKTPSVPLLGEVPKRKKSPALKKSPGTISSPVPKQPPIIEKKAPSSLSYLDYCQRAVDLLKQKKYNEAKKDFHKAQTLEPCLPDAYRGLGQLAHQQADGLTSEITAALIRLQLFQQDAKKNKTNIAKARQEHCARLEQQQQKYTEAVTYYEQSLARNPSQRTIYPSLKAIGAIISTWPTVLDASTSEPMQYGIPFFQRPVSSNKSVSQPLPNQAKSGKAKSIVREPTGLMAPQLSPNAIQQPHPSERWIDTALQEEEEGRYQAAINAYLKVTNGPWVIMTKQKCVVLHVKLQQFDKAFKQANYLATISEDVYSKQYLTINERQEAPFDCHRYHRSYSLYQRGKLHLNATRFREAIDDFESILSHELQGDELDRPIYNDDWRELFMRTHIKLGRALFFRMQSMRLLIDKTAVEAFYQRIQVHYDKAIAWITVLGDAYDYKLLTIYSGLAELGRAQGTDDAHSRAYAYYEQSHSLIVHKTSKRCFPNLHRIQQQLHYLADQVSGHLIYRIMNVMFEKKSYARNPHEQLYLRLSEEIYLKAAAISSNEPCASTFQLIKLDLIFSRYEAALVKIQRALTAEPKQIGSCQRELHLFEGLCYEWLLEYQLAFKSYEKASSMGRYSDDHHQHRTFIEKAELYLSRTKKCLREKIQSFHSMRSNHLDAINRNQMYQTAYSCLENGRKEHTSGNIEEAKALYRQYLYLICKEVDDNTVRMGAMPPQTYDVFYQFANAVILHESLQPIVEAFLFPWLTATKPLFPLTQTDLAFFDILTEIYSACALYEPKARFHLISIAIVSKEYDKAIEHIKTFLSMTGMFPNSHTSQRDLFYIAGRVYETIGSSLEARNYYQLAKDPTSLSDENARAHKVMQAAQLRFKNIEEQASLTSLNLEDQGCRFR